MCYFFRKNSNLHQEQALLFLILMVVLINILFLKKSFFKIISIPLIIGIGFLFLLWTLPLYQQQPDWSSFYLTQKTEYIFLGDPQNVEIKEESEYGKQVIKPSQTNQHLFLVENNSRSITFEEKISNSTKKNMFVVKLPNNTIYIIYPGSKITIQKNDNKFIITKEYWKNEYYTPTSDTNVYIDNTNIQEQKNKSDFSLKYMIDEYENNKKQYIIDQAWWIIIMQPLYQKFSKKILDLAYSIRPNIYEENRKNYNLYKDFLGRNSVENNYEEEKNRRNLILEQTQKWREETRLLQ